MPTSAFKTQNARQRFRDWTLPGPVVPGGIEPAADESLDALCGRWWIFQKKRGHRYSTDDVLCAWYASQWAQRVDRYCDLGSGIGSVALMVAWRRPGCSVVTVEVQEESLALQRKSIAFNGLCERFTSVFGDLRDPSIMSDQGNFGLVTGSPPYWAQSAALPADRPQAVGARLETKGTVADYAIAAEHLLAPGGMFVCVFQASHDGAVRSALKQAGLALIRTRPFRFKEAVPAKESGAQVYLAMRMTDVPASVAAAPIEEPSVTIRRADGSIHPEYAAIKMSIGFPP